MENSIILLGNSQTFLGVVSTLIILCIAKNQNNFIYCILKKIRSEFIEHISYVKPKISFKDIKDENSYKTVSLFLKDKDNRLVKTPSYDECTQVQAIMESEILLYQNKITDWESTYKQYSENVERKTEQVNAPLFAFAFSIVVFMLDEYLRCSYVNYKYEALLFLSLFSILTLVFWTIKWLMFLFLPLRPNSEKANQAESTHLKNTIVQIILHYTLTALGIVGYNCFFKPSYSDLSTFIVFNLIWLCIYILFGLIHSIHAEKDYSEGKALMHYVYHFIYMIVFSLILVVYISYYYPQIILQMSSFNSDVFILCLKLTIWTNVLLLGFISPFALPFFRYNLIYLKAVMRSGYIYFILWKSKLSLKRKCNIIAKSIEVD